MIVLSYIMVHTYFVKHNSRFELNQGFLLTYFCIETVESPISIYNQESMMAIVNNNVVYALVGNIPSFYHASDLRNYFSRILEQRGFDCFHFRHRPEIVKPVVEKSATIDEAATSTAAADLERLVSSHKKDGQSSKTVCCIIRLQPSKFDELLKSYHRKCWLDEKGNSMKSVCHISIIRVADASNGNLVQLCGLDMNLKHLESTIVCLVYILFFMMMHNEAH